LSTLASWVQRVEASLIEGNVGFGHGTVNAYDEAAWLVLHALGLPVDSDLDAPCPIPEPQAWARIEPLLSARINTRKPLAYLLKSAWLQGVAFYVDERSIVPRSFIAELLVDGSIDAWLSDQTHRVLDLCTGNGSLAVLAAMAYPDVQVDAADLSEDALAVAKINVDKHDLAERITLLQGNGLAACASSIAANGPYDLILCNPPYVNAQSMAALPAEYRAEPELALASGADGMDFCRDLIAQAADFLSDGGVLVLEIGNERANFEAAFAHLQPQWLMTSAGEDAVLLLTAEQLRL
jgi:ribosomal protein L3 glutamine methyltransferase